MKVVPGYQKYKCDESGNIYDQYDNIVRQSNMNSSGYRYVRIADDCGRKVSVAVHRVIAATFYGKIENGFVVDHIDGNKLNNNVSNLEVVSVSENIKRSVYYGDYSIVPRIGVIVTYPDDSEIEYPSIANLAKTLGISEVTCKRACELGNYSLRDGRNLRLRYISTKHNFMKHEFKRKIYVYDIIEHKITEYESIYECCCKLNISKSAVYGRINGSNRELIPPLMGYLFSESHDDPLFNLQYTDIQKRVFQKTRDDCYTGKIDGAGTIRRTDGTVEQIYSLRKYCRDRNFHRKYFNNGTSLKAYGEVYEKITFGPHYGHLKLS